MRDLSDNHPPRGHTTILLPQTPQRPRLPRRPMMRRRSSVYSSFVLGYAASGSASGRSNWTPPPATAQTGSYEETSRKPVTRRQPNVTGPRARALLTRPAPMGAVMHLMSCRRCPLFLVCISATSDAIRRTRQHAQRPPSNVSSHGAACRFSDVTRSAWASNLGRVAARASCQLCRRSGPGSGLGSARRAIVFRPDAGWRVIDVLEDVDVFMRLVIATVGMVAQVVQIGRRSMLGRAGRHRSCAGRCVLGARSRSRGSGATGQPFGTDACMLR